MNIFYQLRYTCTFVNVAFSGFDISIYNSAICNSLTFTCAQDYPTQSEHIKSLIDIIISIPKQNPNHYV